MQKKTVQGQPGCSEPLMAMNKSGKKTPCDVFKNQRVSG